MFRLLSHIGPADSAGGSDTPADGVGPAPANEPAAPKKRGRKPKAVDVEVPGEKPKPKAKAKQEELPGMPKLDGVGKAARRFREALEATEAAATEKGEAMDNLIKALRKAKRTSAQIDGYHFQYKHNGPSDRILVKKPK